MLSEGVGYSWGFIVVAMYGGMTELTYTKVMDKCKEYEATVRDYIAMANDNSQLQTARISKFGPQLIQEVEVHRQRQEKQKQLWFKRAQTSEQAKWNKMQEMWI